MVSAPLSDQVMTFVEFEARSGDVADAAAPTLPKGTLRILATYERLAGGGPCLDLLAGLVLTLLAVSEGNSCLSLERIEHFAGDRLPAELAARSVGDWVDALAKVPLITTPASGEATGPLVLDGTDLYLQRYFTMEQTIASVLRASDPTWDAVDPLVNRRADLCAAIDRQFPDGDAGLDAQRRAARSMVTSRVAVIAGGPGSGKTTTVAKAIIAMHAALGDEVPIIRLAAPTGKAAARMRESLGQQVELLGSPEVQAYVKNMEAVTLHRLLGLHGSAVHRTRDEKLPAEVVICDETSMTALPLLAELITALRDETRLVLVGDPAQLRSVDVGTVMDDLVGDVAPGHEARRGAMHVTVLDGSYRAEAPELLELFRAVRLGETDEVVRRLRTDAACIEWIELQPEMTDEALQEATAPILMEVIDSARSLRGLARAGSAEARWGDIRANLVEIKVLTGQHGGKLGRRWWTDRVASKLQMSIGTMPQRIGLPVLVTKNDPASGLFNGDVGVVTSDGEGGASVSIDTVTGLRTYPTTSIAAWLPWWAMTIHKSQGSEFGHVVVALPPSGSKVITRELLYTGLTRAKSKVTIIATEENIREAMENPVARSSGLRRRIWGERTTPLPR